MATATAPATDQDRRLRGRRGTLGTGAGRGVQPAMVRAHSRALALSVMPGNSRRGTVKLRTLWVGEAGAVGYPTRMTTPRDPLYAGYRYPAELISYAVWLYFRFPLACAWSRRCWQ